MATPRTGEATVPDTETGRVEVVRWVEEPDQPTAGDGSPDRM
jgi:hypothetical protein